MFQKALKFLHWNIHGHVLEGGKTHSPSPLFVCLKACKYFKNVKSLLFFPSTQIILKRDRRTQFARLHGREQLGLSVALCTGPWGLGTQPNHI